MAWAHFEQMAEDYSSSRPPYPKTLFEVLRASHVIGPGMTVLEIGAGSGLATRELVSSGSHVVALEPGRELATILMRAVPSASVLQSRLEDATLPDAAFDSVVAATSMHWVDLSIGLPRLHAAVRPGGALAVFRNIFEDDGVRTEFRDRVGQIVARRTSPAGEPRSEARPTMSELAADGWFVPVRSERWAWAIELTAEQVTRLFRTFSNWTEREVNEVNVAAEACGGRVTEHYQSVVHILRKA
jgi:cyclopropane fatty-acyl-phospholipid synthase-like methyltransferase